MATRQQPRGRPVPATAALCVHEARVRRPARRYRVDHRGCPLRAGLDLRLRPGDVRSGDARARRGDDCRCPAMESLVDTPCYRALPKLV